MMMKRMIDMLMGRTRVLIDQNERAVWLYKGEVQGILGAGEHVLRNRDGSMRLERQSLGQMLFVSNYEQAVLDKLPADVAAHLTLVRTGADELAIIDRDGIINTVIGPDSKRVYWTDAGPWTVRIVAIGDEPRIDTALLKRLQKTGRAALMAFAQVVEVDEGKTALVSIDGRLTERLDPGVYGYWTPGRKVAVKTVDLTRQSLDVTGQEVLTRDRVTLRLNLAATYRVVDPVLAVTAVKDFADALYRALQYAFRKTLAARTLDQVLEQKGSVDAEAADEVRTSMAAIGIEVTDIILKDVILPGEMRDLLNQVVAAQKAAEANVIRRREETNATRSLLNTAKVMAENPVMLRLKELEALEVIAGKVERLTVYNGTGGLMNDIVRLTDER